MSIRISFKAAAPIVVLLLGAHLVACEETGTGNPSGSSGTAGSGGDGGAAGSGNTGGNGGSGGGGMNVAVCSAAEGMVASQSWPWFGFEQPLPDPMPDLANGAAATVAAIEPGGLRITFAGAASDVRLAWSGPDLKQVFTAGDMITVTMDAGVQDFRVSGAKGQAVVFRYANATVPATLPAIPGGGPNLAMETACVFEQVKMCPMAEKRTLYTITASLGADSAKIPSGMTGQVGAWQIRHIKTMNLDFFTGMDCTADKFFDGAVHALEVKP